MGLFRLPGLVDVHVHLRDPGQTHKEDFYTGTLAALKGGFTSVFDMPNNAEPITTVERLMAKRESAEKQIVSDLGLYFGTLSDNIELFNQIKPHVRGLKIYLNQTTGGFIVNTESLTKIFEAWNDNERPILLHAEDDVVKQALEASAKTGQRIHVCHASGRDDLDPVFEAKKSGVKVTCGVTPHHLFLTEDAVKTKGVYAQMKPTLKSQADQDYLWANLHQIDCIESDHAPHTHEEKQAGAFGVPGLETTLGLVLMAERQGNITRDEVIRLLSTGPKSIVSMAEDDTTYIEVSDELWTIKNENLATKCGWSPFDGQELYGKVQNVFIRGNQVLKNGELVSAPGSGHIL
jgi:dihydroorotase